MSYDILVFDPDSVPRDVDAFLAWTEGIGYGGAGVDLDDPENGTVALRNWYSDFTQSFPPVNGPLADADDGTTTYRCGSSFTLAQCPDDETGRAVEAARNLAAKHGVGFFDPNTDDDPLFPVDRP